ncbi:MAG TPA: translesion error-prone DNA polymerase V autoproteolytic subunit [Pelovirga sp.]|nr:translesion error-prone DNA polymerase V autoproteolytic subunit [Pelovirga sp.]
MSDTSAKNPFSPTNPFFTATGASRFPSPVTDYCESRLDLNKFCIQHPAATFFVRAAGDSMIEAGIFPGDLVIVDRALEAKHNDIIVVAINGELTIKKLETRPSLRLVALNSTYQPIGLPEESDLEIFGVAIHVIHSLRNPSGS